MAHVEVDDMSFVRQGGQELRVAVEVLLVSDVMVENNDLRGVFCKLTNFVESRCDIDKEHERVFYAMTTHAVVVSPGDKLSLAGPSHPCGPGRPEAIGAGRVVDTDFPHGADTTRSRTARRVPLFSQIASATSRS